MEDCGYMVREQTKADFIATEPFEVDHYSVSMCTEGTLHIMVNLEEYTIAPGDILFLAAKDMVCIHDVSDDFAMKQICITQIQLLHEASAQIFPFLKDINASRAFILNKETPLLGEISRTAYETIYNFLGLLLSNVASDSRYEQGVCAFRCLFLAMRDRPSLRQRQADSALTNSSLSRFNRFMLLLNVHCKTHHEVEYYASELHITAQYLGRICRKYDGRSAKHIIGDTLILQLKSELKNTDKTIKEISYEYNFPNCAFMSSFFRRHAGITPSAFRAQYREG